MLNQPKCAFIFHLVLIYLSISYIIINIIEDKAHSEFCKKWAIRYRKVKLLEIEGVLCTFDHHSSAATLNHLPPGYVNLIFMEVPWFLEYEVVLNLCQTSHILQSYQAVWVQFYLCRFCLQIFFKHFSKQIQIDIYFKWVTPNFNEDIF